MLRSAFFLTAMAVCANAQAVISIHSGVVHYFEGAVTLNGQPLEARLGKFASMADGSELRTAQGRAEVLLTPGVVLRLDQNSSLRMLSNAMADTRVELLAGSAMVDASQPVPGTALTLLHKDWQVRFQQAGLYRLDSEPARLWVRDGEAEVSGGSSAGAVLVERGMDLPLNATLASEPSVDAPRDQLDSWSNGRADSISADNAIAANIQDPGTQDPQAAYDPSLALANLGIADPGSVGFTQFPMLGLSPISPLYSSLYPYQPGFYSLYLPGYTYRPLFLMVTPLAVRGSSIYSPYLQVRPGGLSTLVAPRAPTSIIRPSPTTLPAYRPAPVPVGRPTVPAVRAAPAPRIGGRR